MIGDEDSSLPLGQANIAMVFYAEPTSLEQAEKLKTVPDSESLSAAWFTADELEQMEKDKKLRFNEPVLYARYILGGGQITPISLISDWIPSEPPKISQHKHFKIEDGLLTKF
mmetsp:Transcript_35134/g.46262  ORF Transcript_35134/g.46262 Transcript_35134/m.46262 type:complete len:113 (+) Transcript_35134:262-600(+)